jgi:ABC-type antimicrobial peptide transport system permease subunit
VLLGAFGAVSLLLSAVGIYGVMTFIVSGRRHEIGIRMALGATPATVRAAVVRDGLTMAVAGAAAGGIAAALLSRLLTRIVYGVSTTDITTFGLAAATLIAVAAVACYVPARRASQVDPLSELR